MGILGCSSDPSGPLPPAFQPVGSAPTASVTQTIGPPPLEGQLRLTPPPGGAGWRFEIDLTGDGSPDHMGLVNVPLVFDYRFESPGTFALRVVLTGPEGREIHEWPVAVADASRVRVVARTLLLEHDRTSLGGIATDRAGQSVFVSEYFSGTLWRLDAQTLVPLDLLRLDSGITSLNGLSVTPSDSFLFAIHGSDVIDVISLTRWELVSSGDGFSGGSHVFALNDSLAYASGDFPLVTLLNVYTAEHRSQLPWARPYQHFDVSPRGDLFAAVSWGEKPPVIVVADQEALTPRRNIAVPKFVNTLAFDPSGERLFASVYREQENGGFSYHLVMIDPYSGAVLRDMWGDTGMGLSNCEGNPTARSANGRWIVFACRGAVILDAGTGFPVAILEGSVYAVAAGIEGDVFYLAHSDGMVEKIEIVE